MKRILFAAAALACTLAPAALSAQKFVGTQGAVKLSDPVSLDPSGLFLDTFVSVGQDMFIAGQPTERGLSELRARGVTTVINLRTPQEMQRVSFDEAALAKQLGMTYVSLPLRGDSEFPYNPAAVDKVADAVHSARGKVLLHCTIAWRASHMWAAYLIKDRDVPVSEALANARLINLMDEHHTGSGPQPVEELVGRRLPELRHAGGGN